MVRFIDRTPPERDRSAARSTTSYPPRTASVPRQSGGPPPWQSNQGSWNRPRGDLSASNRPPWQGYNRQSAAPGDRWRNQGQNSNAPRWTSNEWPTNRNSFPWGSRQRSWSDSSSVALRDAGQQPRQWGAPPTRPPPGASDTAPRGQENRPTVGEVVCCVDDRGVTLNYTTRTRIDHVVLRGSRACLLYTSPSPRDGLLSRMPSSA